MMRKTTWPLSISPNNSLLQNDELQKLQYELVSNVFLETITKYIIKVRFVSSGHRYAIAPECSCEDRFIMHDAEPLMIAAPMNAIKVSTSLWLWDVRYFQVRVESSWTVDVTGLEMTATFGLTCNIIEPKARDSCIWSPGNVKFILVVHCQKDKITLRCALCTALYRRTRSVRSDTYIQRCINEAKEQKLENICFVWYLCSAW